MTNFSVYMPLYLWYSCELPRNSLLKSLQYKLLLLYTNDEYVIEIFVPLDMYHTTLYFAMF